MNKTIIIILLLTSCTQNTQLIPYNETIQHVPDDLKEITHTDNYAIYKTTTETPNRTLILIQGNDKTTYIPTVLQHYTLNHNIELIDIHYTETQCCTPLSTARIRRQITTNNIIIIGHSQGGYYAYYLAAEMQPQQLILHQTILTTDYARNYTYTDSFPNYNKLQKENNFTTLIQHIQNHTNITYIYQQTNNCCYGGNITPYIDNLNTIQTNQITEIQQQTHTHGINYYDIIKLLQ